MIEIPEVVYEVWNFLVEHKAEVAFPILIAILSGVFANYIWDWLKTKWDRKRRIAEVFEVCKKTKKLTPEDFRIAEHHEYYYERAEDGRIREALSQGKSVFIIGRPMAGKTRAAYEAVKRLEGFKVVKFWEKLFETEKIPKLVGKGKSILVLDNLDRFVDKVNLYEAIKKFKEVSKSVVVVATCRSGKELEEAEEKFSDVLRDFERVEIGDVSEEKAREVANRKGIEFESFDGTIGSLFLGLDAMRMRFEREQEECKILFWILKLLHDARIFVPGISLVKEIYRRKLERDRFHARMSFESVLEQLKRDSFVFVFKKSQVIIVWHETYLDFTGYSASVDDFYWLKEVLVELKDEEGLFYIGNAFCGRKLYMEGIKCYNESLNLKETAVAYSNRGTAYADLKQHERAIKDYNKAIELNPNLAEAYNNRGITYYELKQHERAIKDYGKAIELNPNLAEAYSNRGAAYADLEQYKREIEDYNKAIELNQNYAEAYYNRGTAYAMLNQYKRAIEDYSKAIEFNPNLAEAHSNRGTAYAMLNQYKRAIEDYSKAIELNQNYAEAYINRGITYSEIGGLGESSRDLKKAGILFLKSARTKSIVKAFSTCFKLREEIESDDVVYCGLALFLITVNPDVIIELRKLQIQDETLRIILDLVVRKLRNENISEEVRMLEERERQEEMMLLLGLLK